MLLINLLYRVIISGRSRNNTLLLVGILLTFISSCNDDKKINDSPPRLFSQPKTVLLNTSGGYMVNQLTGDSIQPIINSLGDVVISGVPIPAVGNYIHPDSVAKPKAMPAGKPKEVPSYTNKHIIPDKLTIIPVDERMLKKFTPGEINSSFVLVNSIGDTIPTGIPIPTKGKVVPCIQPQPTVALPPRMKDDANSDIQFLDLEQGMKSSVVSGIVEDRNGNLWFGTQGGGLSKYDGRSFTHYSTKEGLSHISIRSLMEDRKGNLWIGTRNGGVNCFDGTSFTHFTENEGLSHNWVISILEDKKGNLWFGTVGGGVSKYDGKSFTHFTEKEGLSSNWVTSILEDKKGNLWFGTRDGGVNKYDGKSFTHFNEQESLSNYSIRTMLEDKNGNLWFGTDSGGVNKYDGKSFTHFTEKEGLLNNTVKSIVEDSDGNLWFGTLSGVSKYDGTSFTNYTEKEGLSFSNVESIMEDKSGILWIGTKGGGVNRINSNSFAHYTEKEGLSDYTITSMSMDKNENLLLGIQNGVNRFNGHLFTHFINEEGFFNNNISSVLEDKSGNLWIGTWYNGVSRYDGEMITKFTEKEGLSSNWVLSILEDKKGNLWFGTRDGGVNKYDGKSFTHFTEKEGLSSNVVLSILEDKKGNLWFGTFGGGVSKYDGKSFTNITEKEGLSSKTAGTIFEDKGGILWFGTSAGVNLYDPSANSGRGSFTYYTEKEGLSSNTVRSISEDKAGNIWVGTGEGLNHLIFEKGLNKRSTNESKSSKAPDGFSIHVYDNTDGLKSIVFGDGFIDSKNRAWWTTRKSLVMRDLEKLSPATKPPVVQLTQLDINETFIDYGNISGDLASNIAFNGVADFSNYPLQLELSHELNHITFHFAGIDWAAPQKIKYSYKLEGLTKNWSLPSAENKADFRNLPYGAFTFKVRALGDSQEWSAPFTYTFTIHPPWWLSWWAYGFYGLCFIAGIFVVDRFQRKRLLDKAHAEAREKELEQAKEIKKAYNELEVSHENLKSAQSQLIQSEKMASLGELTAGIAHEIQNPLNFVNNFSEVNDELIEELKDAVVNNDQKEIQAILKDLKENESKIKHHGQRAEGIVKGMLQHSRTSQGEKEPTDINALADEYLRLAYHGMRAKDKSFNAEFKTEFDENLPKISVVPQDIGRVLLNLINNAFYAVDKKAKEGIEGYKPEVIVTSKATPLPGGAGGGFKGVQITVKDNGPGIPDEIKEKIFQPFFTTKPTGSGTGLGLSLSYDIVKAHGGELEVESLVGDGSTFIARLPFYKNTQI